MTPPESRPLWVGAITWAIILVIAAIPILLIQYLFGDPLEREIEEAKKPPPPLVLPSREAVSLKTEVNELKCFGCHSIEEFHKGDPKQPAEDDEGNINPKAFAHDKHVEEGLVHCHLCHAFQGHFHATIRMETCSECH